MTQVDRNETALDLADSAIGMARRHKLPTTPHVFEVFFTHFEGENASVVKEVQALMDNDGMSEAQILDIHERHLSQGSDPLTLTDVEEKLSVEIAKVFTNISEGMASNSTLTGKLKDGIRDLSQSKSKEELRDIARHLVKSNQAALSASVDLNGRLEASRAQIEAMRDELEQLRENALTDHLTGVLNRRAFDELIVKEMSNAGTKPLSLVIIDIDHFKSINDTWGHNTGDNVLRRLGQLLRDNTKGKDKAARLGGEEFAIILPSTDINGAHTVSEHIRTNFEGLEFIHTESGKHMSPITLSAGIATMIPGEPVEALYERADKVLYEAKTSGRNRTCIAA
ncbi:MAG: GGDEF domain-containing protein [Pseudomonadota bacterium]